jgi:purine-binding chemotaxis protein CheW
MAEMIQIVSLMLGGEKYGINIMDIEEILRMLNITKVPKAPSFVEGIINLRGQVIPIVDLRKKMGVMVPDESGQTRIINVNIKGKKIGFVVDNVDEVLRLDPDVIDKAPGVSTGVDTNYIQGVARTHNGMIIILNVHKIFSSTEASTLSYF